MKQTALLTWFHYNNFGTVLQLYALNKVIKNIGFRNDVIDYKPRPTYKKYSRLIRFIRRPFFYLHERVFRIKSYIYKKHLLKTKENFSNEFKSKNEKFDIFRTNEFSFSCECQTASDLFQLNDKYEAFICGSDQIWSPLAFNTHYYLDFVTNTNKMIAYAPSIGQSEIKDRDVAYAMRTLIGRFTHLSVREDSGCDIVKKLTQKECNQVLDPSMLLCKDDYNDIIEKYVKSEECGKYILCYFLGDNEKYWKAIKKFAQKTGLSVRVIPIFNKDYCRSFEICSQTGPAEFLSLIRNASFVCTDSFHGTIFSIIYEKPFCVFERFSRNEVNNNQNSRIYSLLKLFDLEDRLVSSYKEIQKLLNSAIDFETVNNILEKQRKTSIQYLSNALKSASSDILGNYDYKVTNTCSGCGTCAFICSQKAIQIVLNSNGFYESVVEQSLCIRCNECRSVCPFGKNAAVKITKDHSLYAIYSKNADILATSTSGGIGRELAVYFNAAGQDVFGCVYNKFKRKAETICISTSETEKIPELSGSKYLQSDTADIYKKIYQSEGGIFFGTPCQVAAVNLLLQKYRKRQQFILVDLICHGVPSDLLWKKYLTEGAMKYHYGENPDVIFRYKKHSWKEIYIYIYGNGKTYKQSADMDTFYRFFLGGNCYMDSCYECKFRDGTLADIRIGDYWGPRFDKNNPGVSMVLPITNSGFDAVEILHKKGVISLEKTDICDMFSYQQTNNAPKPFEYERLMIDLRENKLSLSKLVNKYMCCYYISAKIINLLSFFIRFIKTKICRP